MGKHSKATYFHGTLTDGNNMIRMVGFDQRMHEEIHKYYNDKESVIISNCEICPSKLDNDNLKSLYVVQVLYICLHQKSMSLVIFLLLHKL